MQTALPDQPAGQTGALAPLRLLIGFLQAVALSGLVVIHHDDLWPGKSSFLFSALLMASLFLPVLWLSGLGWLSASQMRRWSCGALSLILVFAAIDVADGAGTVTPQDETAFFIQTRFGELLLGAGLILYIGHALVLAGARERRWIASRAGCLSWAWKLGVQLMLSLVTVAALSIPLRMVGAMWVGPCEVWPVVLACGVGFAGAMHLTDSARSGRRAALPA
jgi:hypothetical protein